MVGLRSFSGGEFDLSLSEAHAYTHGEKVADSIGHALGVGASIAGLVMLVLVASRYSGALPVTSFALYGGTLLLVFSASALYNIVGHGALRKGLRLLDHSSIYLMIAGTYTPIALNSILGAWGWSLFSAVWGLALSGIALKLIFPGRCEKLSILLYLATGWAGLAAIEPLVANLHWAALALLGIGGLLFSAGVAFHLWTSLRYHNVIWHGFVLAGAACHYFSVIFFVRPTL
jgi:hemolysin III